MLFSYIIVSAPRLMSTVGPMRLITAPLPLEIVMPMSDTEIIAPVAFFIRMPPVGPGTSLMTMPFMSGVCNVMPGKTGGTISDSLGISAMLPQ